jgi:cell wall-associated NlpC family hydrolase
LKRQEDAIGHPRAAVLCALVLAVALAAPARAEEPGAPEDWLNRCLITVRSYEDNVNAMWDDDPATGWASASGSEQYLQIDKPRGAATLSLLWGQTPAKLRMQVQEADQWITTGDFSQDPLPPETLVLPQEACSVRLLADGEMRIAELRIHSGYVLGYFSGAGYAAASMPTPPPVNTKRPLERGMEGERVKALQRRLKELGYFRNNISGTFAQNTYLALCNFQRSNGLAISGVADDAVMAALDAATAIPTQQPPGFDPSQPYPRTASALVTFFRAQIGKGYLYGSIGEISSLKLRQQRALLYPQYERLILGEAAKWDGVEVYDCNGLFKAFLELSEGGFPPEWHTNVTGAVKRWAVEMGPIETMPKQPGIMLLQQRDSSRDYMHDGLYIGNGLFVHSRGHVYGVRAEQMPQLWTHWARLSWLDYDMPEEIGDVPWDGGLLPGDRALVDTASGEGLSMHEVPVTGARKLDERFPNHSVVTIEDAPIGANYYRLVTGVNRKGETQTAYVYAKDLTALSPLPTMPPWPAEWAGG